VKKKKINYILNGSVVCSMFYEIDCSGAIEEESGCLVIKHVYKPPLVLEYDVGFCFEGTIF
jgi:hypothetical protein